MPTPHDALTDPERLSALREADLLDSPQEEGFDQLARLAARLLNAPIALVSLVDVNRQFFKSCVGEFPQPYRTQRETPLSHSFCKHVISSKQPLVVEDAPEHPLVRDNPLVVEHGVRAYIGFPLVTPEGHALGTLCVVDSRPRAWTADQIDIMRSLAIAAMSTVAYRSAARAAVAGVQRDATGATGAAALSSEAGDDPVLAADALANKASEYLARLDDYDTDIRNPVPTRESLHTEAGLLDLVVAADGALREAAKHFGEHVAVKQMGGSHEKRSRLAVQLWEACRAYFEAQRRRAEVSVRFQELRAGLSDVEQEVAAATSAEQAVRLACHNYVLRREQIGVSEIEQSAG